MSRTRLRSAVVTSTVAAGLVLTSMAGTVAATAAPSTTSPAVVAMAPDTVDPVASGFTFQINNDPKPLCNSGLPGTGSDFTDDPAIDLNNCAYVIFDAPNVTDVTKLKAELWEEGAAAKFADAPTAARTTPADAYQATLEPDATWATHAGKIRLVIKYDGKIVGEGSFYYNGLQADVAGGADSAPNTAFNVTGTIVEHVAGTTTARDDGVPAKFKVQVTDAGGTVLHTSTEQTAAAAGTFTYSVPASVTNGINPGPSANYQASLRVSVIDATYDDTAAPVIPGQSATGVWKAKLAGSAQHIVKVAPTELTIKNSFVSSVGWVKPGDTYPSQIIITNPTAGSVTPTSVKIDAPAGSTIVSAGGTAVNGSTYTWTPGAIASGATKSLTLESKAATTAQLSTIVWRDLSTTAVLKVPTKTDQTSTSRGPKVIPPSDNYDTARYGDRPFPIIPVQYTDRAYQASHSGDSLETVINDPTFPGSTYNLYQEMSLGQLYPEGTVPSKGIASKDFTYAPGFDFTTLDPPAGPSGTCHGVTYADLGDAVEGTPLYPERITNGVYNLPGQTEYYGSDGYGSAVVTSQTPAGIQDIDHGCGDTGKLVYDAAAIADPEIDYSDYDTDKDGVVDFFMVVFAGCGGNGGSQLGFPAGCDYSDPTPLPYDNVWPHSSTLEGSYSDPVTGLPGFTTDDQLKDLEGRPLWYQSNAYDPTKTTTTPGPDALKVYVRVGPYNVNPETAIDKASVISHEYGHSLGLPDFYTTSGRETYGDWNLMATDKSQNMDAFSRQELGWVVPEVLDSTRTETGITDSKTDINTITWQKPDGTPYTLTEGQDGVGRVQNSQMYVAKLPGRQLLDSTVFDSGAKATPTHLWWSGSGNDFNCTPVAGRNLDIKIPGLDKVTDPNATVTLSFKSRWDTEWDYDYGFVMTTIDSGATYTSHESLEGYTTGANTVPPATSNNACQDQYSNGLTGSSGSYAAGTELLDRTQGNYPTAEFVADSYDISDLAGEAHGALRFSYATDPGVSRPGWFIDDVKVTVDPDGAGAMPAKDIYVTDFETSGDPSDPTVFNGGCREGLTTAGSCTKGWKYLTAGSESAQDHAYYMELRDRSGFDFEGHGQIDRDPIGFQPGFYLSYTDEAHGYGNAGTDDPPAQSPLDSVVEVGSSTPNLNDAAFVDGVPARQKYSDAYVAGDATKKGHTDNYLDPSSATGNWEFRYNCLDFNVDSLTGEDTIQEAGDLTGSVTFTMGAGCGDFDYGYTAAGGGGANTAPVAKAKATPATVDAGVPVSLSADGTTDAETPDDLDYSWDFGNGGSVKDATGKNVQATYNNAGTFTATVTVTDPQGLSDTETVQVVVKDLKPTARFRVKPKKPFNNNKLTLSGAKSTGNGLTYSWDFGDGGSTKDATGAVVKAKFTKPGYRTVKLTVKDAKGRTSTAAKKLLVRRAVSCGSNKVAKTGSWRTVTSPIATQKNYCDNLGTGRGKDTLTYRFAGPQLDIQYGQVAGGGSAVVFIDGKQAGTISFRGTDGTFRFKYHRLFDTGLSNGRHTVKLVVSGKAYVDRFISIK